MCRTASLYPWLEALSGINYGRKTQNLLHCARENASISSVNHRLEQRPNNRAPGRIRRCAVADSDFW